MNDLRLGSCIRAERRRQRLRQADVAIKAAVSQSVVSDLERGRVADLTVRSVRGVCEALGIDTGWTLQGRLRDPERLLDARHARLVGLALARLGPGWTVTVEYSFKYFGDRGSVDILAWHAECRILLLIEVKSELVDLQETLRSMHVKERVVPPLAGRERGWKVGSVASILVLPEESSARRSVASQAAVLDSMLPSRTVAVRQWLRTPTGPLHGIWFLAGIASRDVVRNPGSPGRVSKAKSSLAHAQHPPSGTTTGRIPGANQPFPAPIRG